MYAVVDIETTGGYANRHRITEVAVFCFDGKKITKRFEKLVNPEIEIPAHITALTGINNDMVAKAPTFAEIAQELDEILKDQVFVAHNVNFDYSFLKKEFNEAGINFQRKKLCTVRLSRKLIPGLPSYSLGKLCSNLGIELKNAHRAAGDTAATVKLLKLLLKKDSGDITEKMIKRNSREATLPPNLPKSVFDTIPNRTGVYYFKDAKGKVVYVGKARNLKKRISSHFTGDPSTWQKQNFFRDIHDISFDLTGNEFLALLLEAHQIKKLWPAYNRAQKQQNRFFGMVEYEDRAGFRRLGVNRLRKTEKAILEFHSIAQARNFLWHLIDTFQLCPKLCGLVETAGECFEVSTGRCKGACKGKEKQKSYNKRVIKAMEYIEQNNTSFAIISSGRSTDERSVVMMEKGRFLGFGYFQPEKEEYEVDQLKTFVTPYFDSRESRSIVLSHLRSNHRDQVIVF